jgi:tRNA wybutosine-synthesizing protein 4
VVFRRVIDEFLACTIFAESLGHESAPAANIISLGGGFDSVCFNYLSKCKHRLLFTEVDFKEIVDRKASLIVSDAILNGATQGFAAFDIDRAVLSTDISSYRNSYGYKFGDLRLIEADLRHAEDLRSKLMESGIDTTAPTLIISECVLLCKCFFRNIGILMRNYYSNSPRNVLHAMIDLHKIDTERLSATLGALFPRALWVSYDAVQPNDVFGRMMHSNLVDAGFAIPGFRAYPSIDAHLMRYRTICGWNGGSSAGCTMTEAHDKVLDESCRRKADSIERLDELEEWTMLMNHYCITIGSSCGEFNHIVEIFRTIK